LVPTAFQDTLKVSGLQVSPSEIEDALLIQPDQLILDVAVAGVSGGRTTDEKIPRAWIVLSDAGKKKGCTAAVKILDAWCRKNLSKYKWLRGGFEIVNEVGNGTAVTTHVDHLTFTFQIPKSPTGKVLRRVLQDRYEESLRDVRGKL
jgi:acyl-CoA synthetase (AMP-forming)/AMP-acid ligase II